MSSNGSSKQTATPNGYGSKRPVLIDGFGRAITYLRISVTDRCNLRCRYCMPDGCVLMPPERILSFEQITEVARTALQLGVGKIRLTGGEPLVRDGIVTLVTMLSNLPHPFELAMTTNGTLLPQFASALKRAGLARLNISLDTLDPDRYAAITGGGELGCALQGISAAIAAGFSEIKLNCVVERSSDEPDAVAVRHFALKHRFEVRFIRKMNLERGEFWKVENGTGGDCASCNRLRMSSDGGIRPCLFSELSYSVREFGSRRALELAVQNKPASGKLNRGLAFSQIGG
jgi:cyclic pyranopterin phosphate synthase